MHRLCSIAFGSWSPRSQCHWLHHQMNWLNSQVSSWFCRTNDPLICRYPVLNVVVPEKCFKGLLLKFYFRPFGGIRSNRKLNLKSAVNRKRQPEMGFPVGIEGFKAWRMTWASQIGLFMCYFLAIYTLGCREPLTVQ